jgi:ribosomal protein S15P/S13E
MDPKQIYVEINELKHIKEEKNNEIKDLQSQIAYETLIYRIASVKRVLDYMRSKQVTRTKSKYDFDNLLVHCMNKLNGNIDGVELSLEEDHKC